MGLLGSLVVTILLAGFSSAASSQVVVNFPDPNLEALIRLTIAKPAGPIYDTDLQTLTDLPADSLGIGDLTGLEYCTNLATLFLSYNEIDDIEPLAGLTGLQDLRLYANRISDISPLAELTNLTNLDLGDNRISHIGPLAGLRNLIWLLLDDNQIVDIGALAGLTDLTGLYLDFNHISDIGPLVSNSDFAAEDFVTLSDNPLSCESILLHIPALEARGVVVDWTDAGQCSSDTDDDGTPDDTDNCIEVQNGPLVGPNNQLDTDGDGYGNVCDCDFNQSLTSNIQDFNLFLPDFLSATDSGVGTDMDGSGNVGIADFNLFLPCFAAGEPGPSGLVAPGE